MCTNEEELVVYLFAIHELRCQLSYVLSTDAKALDIMDAFMWQFNIAESFMPLLRQMKPEALIIFAHNCIIFHVLGGNQWLQGWGIFMLSTVWDHLDDEQRLLILWPIEEMGWVPP
jgi:hypothetical protein